MVRRMGEDRVLSLLKDGPMTEIDLRFGSGITKDRLFALLAEMTASGKIRLTGHRVRGSRVFELASE